MNTDVRAQLSASDVLEGLLTTRYSCRAFTDRAVPEEDLRRLFTIAQRTASWCNSQAWQVELLSGEAAEALSARLLDRLQDPTERPDIATPEAYEGVYRDRRRTCGRALYDAVGIAQDDPMGRLNQALENFRFFGAPHVAIITSPVALGTYGVMDCGGYVANLLTAAETLGLDAIAQGAIAMYSDAVRDHLDVPEDRWIVCAVSIGYADAEHPANGFRTERESVANAVAGLGGTA
ncbi:nitroreductase [Nocardioides daeguensis]|nr:nitroreductase [Nocardioides daeguensis]MBV6725556.1 nitroreductase [Nocardioides daeguensis]MCR1771416.1 nitroreductase [Nocardioides daeguensis]